MKWWSYLQGRLKKGASVISGMRLENGRWEFVYAAKKPKGICAVVFCRKQAAGGRKGKVCHCCHQRRWRANHPQAAALAMIRDRARRKGREFALTVEDLPPGYVERSGRGNGDLTIDRVDNSRGYTPDNIQPMPGVLNRAKAAKPAAEWEREIEESGMPF